MTAPFAGRAAPVALEVMMTCIRVTPAEQNARLGGKPARV